MRPLLRVLAVCAVALLLVGCSLFPGANVEIDGTWQLLSGTDGGKAIPIVTPGSITMSIDGKRIGGRSACNIYGGTIAIDGDRVTISALSMTEMACAEDLMASEAAYLAALPKANRATRSGDSLVLSGQGVELRFSLVPPVADADLVGTTWTLDTLFTGDTAASTLGAVATLVLGSDGSLVGSTGCRSFAARYTLSGSQVQVTELTTTKNACTTDLVAQDEHVLNVIHDGFSLKIEGDRLTITSGGLGLGYVAT